MHNTAYPYTFKPIATYECALCYDVYNTYESLRSHLCSHLPPTQDGAIYIGSNTTTSTIHIQAQTTGQGGLIGPSWPCEATWL